LTGSTDEFISVTATIVPEIKYAFKIIDAKPQKGESISILIGENQDDGMKGYVLTVNNLKKEKGTYVDTILLITDSPFQPTIKIKVYGNIT
jgi:hypothetical protein